MERGAGERMKDVRRRKQAVSVFFMGFVFLFFFVVLSVFLDRSKGACDESATMQPRKTDLHGKREGKKIYEEKAQGIQKNVQ